MLKTKIFVLLALLVCLSQCKNTSEMQSMNQSWAITDVPVPPDTLSYAHYADFYNQEILRANAFATDSNSLIDFLNDPGEDPSPLLLIAAAHRLGELREPLAISSLKSLTHHINEWVGVEAQYALIRIDSNQFPKESLHRFLDKDVKIYFSPAPAAGYLATLGDPSGFAVIISILKAGDDNLKMLACKQLYHFYPYRDQLSPDYFQAFSLFLSHSNPDIQWQTLAQLKHLPLDPPFRNILTRFIHSNHPEDLIAYAKRILQQKL